MMTPRRKRMLVIGLGVLGVGVAVSVEIRDNDPVGLRSNGQNRGIAECPVANPQPHSHAAAAVIRHG